VRQNNILSGRNSALNADISPRARRFVIPAGIEQPETFKKMSDSYYNAKDLSKFSQVTEWQKELGDKFFDYYGKVFEAGALTSREKTLIALAVSHAIQCPYCIDAYTTDSVKKGLSEEEMMEAVHVTTAIRGGASLVHGVQMMNKTKDLLM